MFNDTSDALATWARGVLGDDVVRIGPPPSPLAGRGVAFHLIDVTPHPAPHGERYRRLHATLRYLAVAWAEDPAGSHELLGRLMFAAMQYGAVELEHVPPPLALWQALGLPPQPGLLLKCQAFHDLPARDVPVVTRTIFATTPASDLVGRVMNADGRPVDRATILVPRYQLRARTDDNGRFRLPAFPSDEPATLVVHANGRQQEVELVQGGGKSPGLVIQLEH